MPRIRDLAPAEILDMHALSKRGKSDLEISKRFHVAVSAVNYALARVMPNGRVAPHIHGDRDYTHQTTAGHGHPRYETYATPKRRN